MSTAKRRAHLLDTDTEVITAAFRRAVREAIEEHYRAGNSITIWRDGKIVEVPTEEIPAILASYDEPTEQLAESELSATRPAPAPR